jgi:ATP diphosphatase
VGFFFYTARQGFDWPDPTGPAAKLAEEERELAQAETQQDREEEAGDLLFAAVNLVRAYGIAPEDALRSANAKFERRFRAMEQRAEARGQDFAELSLDQQEMLWNDVKASELGKPS